MLSILVDAWEDYSPQELTFDIRSLCTIGSKEDCEYPPDNSKIPGKEKQ